MPDLPTNIESSQALENMICQCLELKHKQKVREVKCFIQLGIGVVYLYNEEDKHNLINVIQEIVIEKSSRTMVTFVDELELVSYVVIHTKDMKNLPLPNGICRKWVQLYKTHVEPKCEQLSAQFSNIFRVMTHSLDELLKALSIKDFSIDNQLATVYFQADCCFFEDLPPKTTLDRLKEAIGKQISERYMSKDLIHIQYNKEGANAVVITSGRARVWSIHSSILLDGRTIMKKEMLACRLLIRDVPKGISTSAIQDHEIFANSVVTTLPSSEYVILELSDRDVYDKCIRQGALRIGNNVLSMDTYLHSSNPEDDEINADTWYGGEMCEIKKPDIMPFMSNPQHDIFRWKWNSQAFIDQLRQWKSNQQRARAKDQDKYEKQCDLKRHLLRMTVMLNTIGVVKRGFYRIGDKEIKVKPDQLKTIVYDHKSRLKRSKTMTLSEVTESPYPSTTVRVINEDCLIVYQNLVEQGYRPVILNMANANTPGGGYKRGDGAQEETLFRRSNYHQSLDMSLDDGKPTARFYCNSNCELEPFSEGDDLYPMDEYGAIYTSGLTVFRLQEETGYSFMDIPMYDVCAIAMAAYRDPKMEKKDLLAPKHSIGTRKKIENIFAIAYQHKHDCLVLSALGCGAFRNPPTHVASIFKSVIEQYAGYFKCVLFSIIDDHNAGLDFNRDGNVRPFQKVLDNQDITPKRHRTVDMMVGPRRILKQSTDKEVTLSDIRICHLPPCHFGGKCENMQNEQHCREYSHPPLCPYANTTTSCKEKTNDQHLLWFRHRQKCAYGGECQLLEKDPFHANEFEHPEYCRDGGRCENMEAGHLKLYRHVPLCQHRRQCIEYNRRSADHCQDFRHCVPNCRFGRFCIRFHDEEHMKEENHPFKQPCPFTPFHCQHYNTLSESRNIKSLPSKIQNHCLQYSHVCRFGRQCRDKTEIHWQNTIHVARHMCSHSDQCRRKHQEDHLNSFSHPGIEDIRRLCVNPAYRCHDKRQLEHITQYRHQGNYDRSGVIGCFGQNNDINFGENQENMIKAIKKHTKSWKSTPTSTSSDVQNLVKGLQPVHRCGKVIFESILLHGHVMSRGHMEHLKKPSFVAQAVREHKHVRTILDRYTGSTVDMHMKEFIEAIVSREYRKKYDAAAAAASGTTPATSKSVDDHDEARRRKERILKAMIKGEELDRIEKCTRDIAEAFWNLHNSPAGIGYPPDKVLGTDKHVFSILGPHLGHYYGDIFLVFKPELMLHPDTNFSPQAATSFVSKRTFGNRPWTTDPGSDDERVKCFHQSKLHCSVPGYEYAAANELIAVIGTHRRTMDISLHDIFNRWKKVDSHDVFEAHLPQLVPLDYIEEIYIAKNLFASLTAVAQETAKKIFGDSLHITDHEINLTDTGGGGSQPSDKSRSDYQDYVTKKLIDKFVKKIERSRHLHGTVITLAPSQFSDHIVLPLTITNAFNQHRRTHKHASDADETYIYWQAMSGDMMVTLSNEQIGFDGNQTHLRCLVCYIAERTSTTATHYNEGYSYLNAGDPYRHGMIMKDGRCSEKSQTFHRGCNLDEFISYCLKLEKKSGQVTLSHAGSNGLYCYEKISCQFSKTTLDLNRLKYIHVSAGSQKVPIRNLVVSFEPITDLHPTFDKNFKRGDDAPHQGRKPQVRDRKPSPETKEPSEEKSPSLVGKFVNRVAGLFGYDPDGKALEPCPYSVNCLLQNLSKHMKENSHPCPYSELCPNKDKEPHLTHERHRAEPCSSKSSCQRLNDPVHRAKFRHEGYPDFLTLCRDGTRCNNQTSSHRIKYSHGEQVQIVKGKTRKLSTRALLSISNLFFYSPFDDFIADRSRAPAAARVSPGYQQKESYDRGRSDHRTSCRYGSDCRQQMDSNHCSNYSHPYEGELRSSTSSNQERPPCRYGSDCRDQKDNYHCSRFSHPQERGSKGSSNARHDLPSCRHGRDCRDQDDSNHCSKYSHPEGHLRRDDKMTCKFGRQCHDNDPHHRSKYSHPR